MKANADYTPYLADPDLLVDWSFIEQIVSSYFIIIISNLQFPIIDKDFQISKQVLVVILKSFPEALIIKTMYPVTWAG